MIDNNTAYPKRRDLDGVYFRVKRNDTYEAICFSDLSADERRQILEGRNEEWLKSMCIALADNLREIGDQFDIVAR